MPFSEDGVPGGDVVVADERYRTGDTRTLLPIHPRRQREIGHGFVVSAQQRTNLDERLVGFERRVAATRRFSGDVGEDFAPLFIDAEHAGSPFEADFFEMPQQSVHRGRPGTGAAPHRVPNLYDGAYVTSQWLFFRRNVTSLRVHGLRRPEPTAAG